MMDLYRMAEMQLQGQQAPPPQAPAPPPPPPLQGCTSSSLLAAANAAVAAASGTEASAGYGAYGAAAQVPGGRPGPY